MCEKYKKVNKKQSTLDKTSYMIGERKFIIILIKIN